MSVARVLAGVAGGWLSLMSVGAALAQEPKLYRVRASYEDVKFELNNAIITRGLALESTGKIGDMLERTGADVGSAKAIYKAAEFFTFCSARYSRRMMEADPANVAFCPMVVFIYETEATPGEVVVGYRPPALHGSEASKAALADVDKLLDGIAKDAVKK